MIQTVSIEKALGMLAKFLKCPKCGQVYTKNRFKILNQSKHFLVFFSSCVTCETSLITKTKLDDFQIFSASITTDLTLSDVIKLKTKNPISLDEVMDLHVALRSGKIF